MAIVITRNDFNCSLFQLALESVIKELNFTFLIVSFFFVKSAEPPCRAEPKASLLPSACFSHEDSVKLNGVIKKMK